VTAQQDRFDRQRATMIEHQLMRRGIRDDRVLAAMGSIPRERFVPEADRQRAYEDSALPIGHGQTISQPYMVARMCELARIEGGERVLEVGAGSGYQAAVLARLAGHVVAIERIPELAEGAAEVLQELGLSNVDVVVGDGTQGYAAHRPYDRILVAAGTTNLPTGLLGQLADMGRMVIPIGPRERQTLRVIDKVPGGMVEREHDACVFVPLV
jgi:protein-L-isoaspartate(D-aspartate) O-methyltransferase